MHSRRDIVSVPIRGLFNLTYLAGLGGTMFKPKNGFRPH